MELKYIVFDLHGTLEDSMNEFGDFFVEICRVEGLLVDKRGDFLDLAGVALNKQFENVFQKNKQYYDSETIKLLENKFTAKAHELPPAFYEGAPQTIENLYNSGFNLYLSTGLDENEAHNHLKKGNILNYFSLALGAKGNIIKGNRHIELFKEHSKDEDFCSKAIFVGDGSGDAKIARDNKMLFIGVSTTFLEEKLIEMGAKYVIKSVKELPELLPHILRQ